MSDGSSAGRDSAILRRMVIEQELERLRNENDDLRAAFTWVLNHVSWQEWYYWPIPPEVVRKLTTIDEAAEGCPLKLREPGKAKELRL